jgi:hypothetical protein
VEILLNKPEIKRIKESVEEDIKELLSPPIGTELFIAIASVFIAAFSTINGID